MSELVNEIVNRTKTFTVPKPDNPVACILGVVNFIFFGVGTIIAGILVNNMADVVIGVCQLLIPFVGWVWSIIWGILMILPEKSETAATPAV